ncbi:MULTISPECIES: response regulator transcription factor [Protofrankia]|uniref:response regulator transcription factor n=1 Tax=Protofrankia TaxID=2994361 RepID=UPI000A98B305|nr:MULTISPECIES: response regulator transcription factor [Protofrankia]
MTSGSPRPPVPVPVSGPLLPGPVLSPGPAALTGPVRSGLSAPPGPTLLVADAAADTELLTALADEGMGVSVAPDGARALLEIGRLAPAVVLISARLPIVDGVTVIRTVRTRDDMPILLGVGPQDRRQAAAGLAAGASACVAKPYRVNEVLALARSMWGSDLERAWPTVLRAGAITLNLAAYDVWVDGIPVRLPPREFRLLRILLEQAGSVVTHQTLLERVWGTSSHETNTLAVHIRRLRGRLGDTGKPGKPRLIESVRGVGYRLRLADSPTPGP